MNHFELFVDPDNISASRKHRIKGETAVKPKCSTTNMTHFPLPSPKAAAEEAGIPAEGVAMRGGGTAATRAGGGGEGAQVEEQAAGTEVILSPSACASSMPRAAVNASTAVGEGTVMSCVHVYKQPCAVLP